MAGGIVSSSESMLDRLYTNADTLKYFHSAKLNSAVARNHNMNTMTISDMNLSQLYERSPH